MRNLFTLLISMVVTFSFAQRHEVGVFLGGANVIGDIGKSTYINPLPSVSGSSFDGVPLAYGLIYRYNLNPYMGLRANVIFSSVAGNDRHAPEEYKINRGYKYKNNINEGSVVFEYNLFNINEEYGARFSPYIFGGIGFFMFDANKYIVENSFARDENGVILIPNEMETSISIETEKSTKVTVPLGVGLKYKYNGFVLSAEVGFRYTNTDNLDFSFANERDFTFITEPGLPQADVNLVNGNIIRSRQVGNMSNYDWYVFTGITLTYSFGREPCFCD
ncbi:MAG: DUF6089 family protein [Weeksellaceae bacterium]|nr:DUF6089 family protein [Weeksellaceae bacterium]